MRIFQKYVLYNISYSAKRRFGARYIWKIQHNITIIYKFNIIPIKITEKFFVDVYNNILKFIWESTGPRIAKTS